VTNPFEGLEEEPTIDVDVLARWMDAEGLDGLGELPEVSFISGGSQNEIFEVRRGSIHAARRKPPQVAPAARDEGVLREWAIIEALTGTDVPCTDAVAVCRDSSVLGRPFYLMEYVDGWSVMNTEGWWLAPFDEDVEARKGLAFELIEGIVQMGKLDWRGRGLENLGRPDGYHDRQVERWTRFYDRVKGREVPGLEEATAWLQTHRPLDFVPGLMHGDYQFPNVMFRYGKPAKLAAIVDWEMGTIGDPKLDLAWALQAWPDEAAGQTATELLEGMPDRSELLAYYVERSGRQVDDFDYYLVLACWKLAIVLEQGYQRAGDDVKLQGFGPYVLENMAKAAELAETSDYPATTSI
jgi:aminoglycoside phosphotransferase (APT) family kinase protein